MLLVLLQSNLFLCTSPEVNPTESLIPTFQAVRNSKQAATLPVPLHGTQAEALHSEFRYNGEVPADDEEAG
jgi:hypothetical protein